MHPISIDTDGVCRTLLSPDCVQHTIMVTLQGNVFTSAANLLIGEVVQARRRPLLGPSPG